MTIVTGEPRRLFGCVATYTTVSEDATCRFLKKAYEELLYPCLVENDVEIALQWCSASSEKFRWLPLETLSVNWEIIAGDFPLAWVIFKGWRENRCEDDRSIQSLLAASIRFTDDPKRASVLEFGVSTALLNKPIDRSVQAKTVEMALSSFSEVEGVVGYITVDYVAPEVYGSMSPYERTVGLAYPWASIEFGSKVRGYYWGNLLHKNHIDLLGGSELLKAAPVHMANQVDEERYYLQLTDDINDIDRAKLAQLKEFLKPLLPGGYPQSQEYYDSLLDFIL